MTITQTVEIPANRRLTLEVPREVPEGKVIITFTPFVEKEPVKFINASASEVMTAGDEILEKHLEAFKALAK